MSFDVKELFSGTLLLSVDDVQIGSFELPVPWTDARRFSIGQHWPGANVEGHHFIGLIDDVTVLRERPIF